MFLGDFPNPHGRFILNKCTGSPDFTVFALSEIVLPVL